VYQDYYATEPALSTTSSISWIGSVSSCLLLFCGAFSGRLLDAGYGRFMTISGSILIVLGMLCTSFSGGNGTTVAGKADLVYWQILLSQGVCCGLGMGLVFLPSVGIPATYFVKRRALATGIVTSGASLGGIIYPVIFEQLLDTIGFRWAARVVALVALFTLSAACLLLRQRTDLPRKAKAPMVEFVAFKEPAFLALTLGMAGSFVGVYVPYYFIQTRVEAIYVNLNGLNTIYLVSFLNVGGVFGRLIPNYIADKYEPLHIL
jgi:MFS family permease